MVLLLRFFQKSARPMLATKNQKRFFFLKTAPIKGNEYGRTEEYYQCEDCTGCPYREKCHKSKENRVVRMNVELTVIHKEVLSNLNSTHGALLRMNRSIQAEGVYGESSGTEGTSTSTEGA